jgi:hypothetical protein
MRVKRKDGEVWIEGVRPLVEPGQTFSLLALPGKICTFAGAMEAALAVTRHPYTYDEILGLSGLAFRVRWHVGENGPTGCPCSPIGETPDTLAAFSRASGWQIGDFAGAGWDNPHMQGVIPKIRQSIDVGTPVLVYDKHLNSSIIYGYADRREVFLLQTHMDGFTKCPVSELGQDPALAFLLLDRVEPDPFPAVFKGILGQAVARWHQEKGDVVPSEDLRSGRAALEAWIQMFDRFDELVVKASPGELLFFHLWNFGNLYDARRAAAGFLREHVAVYPSAQEDLLHASDLYRQEAEGLGAAYEDENTYLGASGGETLDASRWTPGMRRREREIMRQALDLERSAVEAMERALSRMVAF